MASIAVVSLAAAAGCARPAVSSSPPGNSPAVSSPPVPSSLHRVHDPGQVTGTLTGPCHMIGTFPDQRPDLHCTPGGIDPAVTQAGIHQTICVKGYTATVRPPEAQTEAFKFGEAYPAYGLARSVKTELDHGVPLELGGDNDASNLWPEPETGTPNPKDSVEGALNRAVCSGRVTLAAAQNAIAANWMTAERVLGLTP